MADNTIQTGADTIATDDLATLNGAASGSVKVQRMKPGFGLDGDFTDVSTINPLPVQVLANAIQQAVVDALGQGLSDATGAGLTLLDVLNPMGDQFVPLPVAPAGIEGTGQRLASGSLPVAVAREHIEDYIAAVDLKLLPIGFNILTGATAPLDTAMFATIWVLVPTAPTAGAYVIEGSNDGVSYGPIPYFPLTFNATAALTITASATTVTANTYVIPCSARFIRMRVSTTAVSNATSISAQIRASRSTMPISLTKVLIDGQTVEAANIAGNVLRVGGYDGTFARTFKTNTTGALAVTPDFVSTGYSQIAISSAATTNATSIKASAGTLASMQCSNTGAAVAFVKLYNKASAPTVGTDVPILTIPIAASGPPVNVFDAMVGFRFSTGIALAITNLGADADATAVAAAQVKVIGMYV